MTRCQPEEDEAGVGRGGVHWGTLLAGYDWCLGSEGASERGGC